jgi:hypothetical protein
VKTADLREMSVKNRIRAPKKLYLEIFKKIEKILGGVSAF